MKVIALLFMLLWPTLTWSEEAKNLPNYRPNQAHKKEGNALKTREFFLTLAPINIPIIRDDKTVALAGITLSFEGNTLEDGKKLQELAPKVRDAMLIDFYLVFDLLWTPDYTPSLEQLKKRFLEKAKAIVGDQVISDILFENFYVHIKNNKA